MREFLPVPDPYTLADAQEFVDEIGNEGRAEGTGFGAAIVETASGRVVGGAGIRLPIRFRPSCEIGYAVYPDGRGHHYAAEVADALARWAFAHEVRRVDIRASVRNIASIKAALAAGFRFEGVRRGDLTARNPVDAGREIEAGYPENPSDRIDDSAAFARVSSDRGEPIPPVLPPFPPGGLRDEVLMLRAVQPADAAAMLEEHNDPVSMSWAFDDKPATAAAMAAAAAASQLQWLVGPLARIAMVDLASGEVAGFLQLRSPGPPNVFGVGYSVRAGFRGRAYTTRALALLMPWAFEVAGVARLELGAKVANIASQKSAANAGFLSDGIRRARLRNPDGSFSDEARFAAVNPALTRPEGR
jgi:RimJ/RimL family protein N-acetyltransferase